MHLSQLTLNPEAGDAQDDLRSPYRLHQRIARAFPDPEREKHRARHGILFRVEAPAPAGVAVLVQSTTLPDWGALEPGYLTALDGPKPFEPAFRAGQRLRFRLVANPVRRVSRPRLDPAPEGSKKDHRVHRQPLVHPLPDPAHGRADGYLPWLLRQADEYGFSLDVAEGPVGPEPVVTHAPFRTARRRTNRATRDEARLAKQAVSHFGVRFDGTLTVTEPEALARAVRSGVGPAKAFGFGLLSLAPV